MAGHQVDDISSSLSQDVDGTNMLTVDMVHKNGETALRLRGDADIATGPLLRHALTQLRPEHSKRVIVDVGGLRFMDAHCIGVIAGAQAALSGQGRALVLRAPGAFLYRVLEILDLDDLVEVPTGDT